MSLPPIPAPRPRPRPQAPIPAPRPQKSGADTPAPVSEKRGVVCIVSCTPGTADRANYETVVRDYIEATFPNFKVFVAQGTPSKWLKSSGATLTKIVKELGACSDDIHYIIGAHGLHTDEFSHVAVETDAKPSATGYTTALISISEMCSVYMPRLLKKTPVKSVFFDICYSGMQQSIGPQVFPVPSAPNVWSWVDASGVPFAGHADAPIGRQSACMRWANWVKYVDSLN